MRHSQFRHIAAGEYGPTQGGVSPPPPAISEAMGPIFTIQTAFDYSCRGTSLGPDLAEL